MAATTSAGLRNRRIVVKARAAGEDSLGQPLNTWPTTVATLWAEILAPGAAASVAAERVLAGRETSPTVYTFRVAYCTNVTAAMRIEHGGQVFEIVQVLPDFANQRRTDLVAVAGVA